MSAFGGRATPVFDAGHQIQRSAERLNRSDETVFQLKKVNRDALKNLSK